MSQTAMVSARAHITRATLDMRFFLALSISHTLSDIYLQGITRNVSWSHNKIPPGPTQNLSEQHGI
jgi:hypothetical protein